MSACSSSTAPSVTADAATTATEYAPAIGGDAETGVRAIAQDTGFDPADPTLDASSSLAARLQQAQLSQQLVAGSTTPSAPGTFQAALGERAPVQLRPATGGASAIANLDTIVQAREERVARLEEAFLTDPGARPADQARLDQERQLLEETRALRDKLSTLADTIDATEEAAIIQLVGTANQHGSYPPERLAELMIQVEGSAHQLPASYLELAMRAQELLEQTRADMDRMLEHVRTSPDARLDPTTMATLVDMSENQLAAHEALKANFELAKRDPATAQAQLQAIAA